MIYLIKPNCFRVNVVCGVYGSTGACNVDCGAKCYLYSCNNGYGSCLTAVLA